MAGIPKVAPGPLRATLSSAEQMGAGGGRREALQTWPGG
jgi:hypothetical protein